jgi:hypothetical protein
VRWRFLSLLVLSLAGLWLSTAYVAAEVPYPPEIGVPWVRLSALGPAPLEPDRQVACAHRLSRRERHHDDRRDRRGQRMGRARLIEPSE